MTNLHTVYKTNVFPIIYKNKHIIVNFHNKSYHQKEWISDVGNDFFFEKWIKFSKKEWINGFGITL